MTFQRKVVTLPDDVNDSVCETEVKYGILHFVYTKKG